MRVCIYRKRRYTKLYFFLFFTIALCAFLLLFFFDRAEPIFKERAADAATQEIRRLIDDIAIDVLSEGEIFEEKTTDTLMSVKLDTYEQNSLRSKFSKELSKKLSDTYYTKIYISAGSLFRNVLLQGIGVKIPARIFFGAISHIDIKDEFVSAGINQTKYRATLEIAVTSSVISTLMSDTRVINVSLPICEQIFIGNVPNYYIPKG